MRTCKVGCLSFEDGDDVFSSTRARVADFYTLPRMWLGKNCSFVRRGAHSEQSHPSSPATLANRGRDVPVRGMNESRER